jgi:hypothetical protein
VVLDGIPDIDNKELLEQLRIKVKIIVNLKEKV